MRLDSHVKRMSACNSNSQISNYVASISGIILGRQGELKFCHIESSHEGQKPRAEALRAPGTRSDEGDGAVGASAARRWYRARFNAVPRFFWQITPHFTRVRERRASDGTCGLSWGRAGFPCCRPVLRGWRQPVEGRGCAYLQGCSWPGGWASGRVSGKRLCAPGSPASPPAPSCPRRAIGRCR